MANINTVTMASSIMTMYEKRLLLRALPRLVHGRWARKATLSQYGDLQLRKFASFSAVTNALGEGSTPGEGSAPTISTVTLDPSYYGSWVSMTDKVELEGYDPIISEVSSLLGEQAGLSADTLIRNALISGATAAYSGGQAAYTTLDSPTHDISYKDIVKQYTALLAANAMPSAGGGFAVIMHPHSFASLMQDATFVNLFVGEENGDAIRMGKVGRLMNCDIYLSSNAYELADGGVGNDDVYGALFIGAESFGSCGMAGMEVADVDNAGPEDIGGMTGKPVRPVEIIVKPLGSSGSNDPLNQRGSAGWKFSLDVEILDSSWIRNLYHTNAFSAD